VNSTALLSSMLGATDASSGPEVAPAGMEMLMDVAPQLLIVTGTPFNKTTLFPCVPPKLAPLICTGLPRDPVVADTLVITGAGALAEFTDTLSKVAVASAVVLPLVTAKPTNTLCAMVMVWVFPNCTQFTPSKDT
jgi:hypothetical protein